MHDWCKKFSEDHEAAAESHAHVQPTAITYANFLRIKKLILEKRQIKRCDTTPKMSLFT
jgi:hypothetical protein